MYLREFESLNLHIRIYFRHIIDVTLYICGLLWVVYGTNYRSELGILQFTTKITLQISYWRLSLTVSRQLLIHVPILSTMSRSSHLLVISNFNVTENKL